MLNYFCREGCREGHFKRICCYMVVHSVTLTSWQLLNLNENNKEQVAKNGTLRIEGIDTLIITFSTVMEESLFYVLLASQ